MNTNLFLENAIHNAPNKIGLVYEERAFTYQEIFDEVNRLTNALLQIGCNNKSRIAILAKNCPESVFLYYACSRIGAVYIPLSYRASKNNLIEMICLVEAEILFVDNDCINMCVSIHPSLPTVKHFVSLDKYHASYLYYPSLVEHASTKYYCYKSEDTDPTAIFFTSGTTGKPKAVVFSQVNFIHHVLNAETALQEIKEVISLVCIPFYHILGFQAITSAFYFCHKLVLIRAFNADEVLQIIEKHQITQTFLPTSKLSAILNSPQFPITDLSYLDNIKYGSDISYAPLILEAMEKFPPHVKFTNRYGLTEATYDVAALDFSDHDLSCEGTEKSKKIIRLNSIGRPLDQIQLIIADDNENELPCGEIGEILIHSQRKMIGYISEESHEIVDDQSYWMHTGDLGYQDEDGYIFMMGQKVNSLPNQNKQHSPILSPNFIVYPHIEKGAYVSDENSSDIEQLRPFINHNTYLRFLKFLRRLYESHSIKELSETYLDSISDFLPASSFGIHLCSINEPIKDLPSSENFLKWDMPYFDTLSLYAASEEIEGNKQILYSQSLSKIFPTQEYIERIKPDHLICVPMYNSSRKLIGVLSFGRIGTNWNFNQYEQNLILMISSHMCTTLSTQLEHDALLKEKELMENIISITGIPVVATDAEGHLIYENQFAHIIIERDYLGEHQPTILYAIRSNIDTICQEGIQQISRHADATFLLDKKHYIVQTTITDTDPPTFVSVINETEDLPNFNFLQNILTNREINVLNLIAIGYSNAEIADALYISVNTVKYHVKNIFQKLDVNTRTELLTKAYSMKKSIQKI